MSNPKDPKHLKWLTDRLDSLYQTVCKAAECLCKLADRPDNDTKYSIVGGALVGTDGSNSPLPPDVDITYDVTNGNLVGTDSNGNVVSTDPLPDDEDTTYKIVGNNLVGTDADGNVVSTEPLPTPTDSGSYVEKDVGDCIETTHKRSDGTASTTYERPKHYSNIKKTVIGSTISTTMTNMLPFTDNGVFIQNHANLVSGNTAGATRFTHVNPSSKLAQNYKLDFGWRVRLDVAQARYDAGIYHKTHRVNLQVSTNGGTTWQEVAYEAYDRQGNPATNGESMVYSRLPDSIVGTIPAGGTLTVDTRIVFSARNQANQPITDINDSTLGQVLVNPPSISMMAVTTE